MTTPDPILAVLEHFQQQTGRMMVSPADHEQARAWVELGMPLSVILRGISDKVTRTGVKWYLRTMPLLWCEHDVTEQYQNWRRAVGPRRPMQVEERG